MKCLLFTLLAVPAAVYAAEPFLIFAADAVYTDAGTPLLARTYLGQQDYLGYTAVMRTAALQGIVLPHHWVEISSSMAELEHTAQRGCGPAAPNALCYQFEYTPDPVADIARAASAAGSGGCEFGLLPEGRLFSAAPCTAKLDSTLYQQLDWSQNLIPGRHRQLVIGRSVRGQKHRRR
jgi:hypothetical protein